MARCSGTRRTGGQCTTIVKPPNEYCYQHDPARSEERKRNASKGGKGTGSREIKDLKKRIGEVVDTVRPWVKLSCVGHPFSRDPERPVKRVGLDGPIPGREHGPLELSVSRVETVGAVLEGMLQTVGGSRVRRLSRGDVLFDPRLELAALMVREVPILVRRVDCAVSGRGDHPTTSPSGVPSTRGPPIFARRQYEPLVLVLREPLDPATQAHGRR